MPMLNGTDLIPKVSVHSMELLVDPVLLLDVQVVAMAKSISRNTYFEWTRRILF